MTRMEANDTQDHSGPCGGHYYQRMGWLEETIWSIPVWEILVLAGIGLGSGMLGGLLGIGGAVVNTPAIVLILARDIHTAQAASMSVTFFVAAPAAYRHWKCGGLRFDLIRAIVPAALIGILLGVTASIWMPDQELRLIFGVFLIYVLYVNFRRVIETSQQREVRTSRPERVNIKRGTVVGSVAGFGAGLLGIGGGLITVPLTQLMCRCQLRQCIACSAAVMCVTSLVGATYKNITLPNVPNIGDVHWWTALTIGVWLIPTCFLGSWIGARLTYVLPLKLVRSVFCILVALASWKFLSSFIENVT